MDTVITPPGTVPPGHKGMSVTHVDLTAAESGPAFPKISNNRGKWVNYGEKNSFPQEIIRACNNSPVQKSIIKSTVVYICGKGIRGTAASTETYVSTPNTSESWDDLIEPTAYDYKTFGGWYWQIVLNKDSATVSLFHQDFSTVRIGTMDEYGNPLTFRIANDWAKTSGKHTPISLDLWPGIDQAEKGKSYLFYHWDYEPGLEVYSIPDWYSAGEYVKADGALGIFYNNSIANGFIPSVVVSMPSNPEPEKKQVVQNQMESAFTGPRNASRVVILWGETDEVKPTITPFSATANADIYNNVESIIFQKIVSANRLASPTLAGVSGSGNLSGNAAEIIDAYVLYNYTVVVKMRDKILDKANLFTRINGTAVLRIDDADIVAKIQEKNGDAPAPATLSKASPIQRLLKALRLWK